MRMATIGRERHQLWLRWRRSCTYACAFILCFNAILKCSGQKPINLGGVKRRDVYIAGFFPYGRHVPESHVGRGVMPSVKLALDHINENPAILRNYRLHMWWNDTEVSSLADSVERTVRVFSDRSLISNYYV